jgi:hypothetical protein
VRVLQRCPHFTSHVFANIQKDPSQVLLMNHGDGIKLEESTLKKYPNRVEHDPSNLSEARSLADRQDLYPIGLFYRNTEALRYDEFTSRGLEMTRADKMAAMERTLDKFSL